MTTRITGLATGLDVDSLVKAELTTYQTKIDTKQQEKEILEIKQELYRDVLTQGSDMWSKYFDILKSDSLLSSKTYSTVSFSSSDENSVTAKAAGGSAINDNYSIKVDELATAAKFTLNADALNQMKVNGNTNLTFKNGDKEVTIDISAILDSSDDDKTKLSKLKDTLNDKLSSLGVKGTYSEIAGGIIVESSTSGSDSKFTFSGTGTSLDKEYVGQDCKYTITSSNGSVSGSSASNKVILDGVEFSFNKVTEAGKEVTLTGKNDASKLADTLVSFFDDYNTMIQKLTSYVTDKHDRDYNPLTEDQKKEMSEDEIKLWNEKVKKGQLYRDNAVNSLITQLKSSMSNIVNGSSATLKNIGITAVNDYGSKNGTFTVDRDALQSALEKNPEEVMKLFISNNSSDSSTNASNDTDKGIFYRLKDVLYNNCKDSTKSTIIKKAGSSSNSTSDTLTVQINKYATAITKMKSTLATKEQKLYSKYSVLETTMNNYNTQLANLQSMFSS